MFPREPVRARLYALIAPVAALLVGYGIVSEAQAALWIGLATAVLGTLAVESARAHVVPIPQAPDDTGAGEVKAVLLTACGIALGLILAGLAFWAFQANNFPVGLA